MTISTLTTRRIVASFSHLHYMGLGCTRTDVARARARRNRRCHHPVTWRRRIADTGTVMNVLLVIPCVIAVCGIAHAAWQIVVERDLTPAKGAPIILAFALWAILRTRLESLSQRNLYGLSVASIVVGVVMLVQFVRRERRPHHARALRTTAPSRDEE
jgi:4-amino-4-deoxy-L-arabinose transferase-like glycosyltransferase